MGKKRKNTAVHNGRATSKKIRYLHVDAPRPGKQHPHQERPPKSLKRKLKNAPNSQHQRPVIPFAPHHSILLVGEGDLSFTASLILYHNCTSIRAGILEKSREELLAKYPHADKNIGIVQKGGGQVLFGLDVTKMAPFVVPKRRRNKSSASNENVLPVKAKGERRNEKALDELDGPDNDIIEPRHHTLKPPGSPLIDRIIFNFPHVGGKSTDVNRQVRANQSLLVQFFEKAIPSLAPGGRIVVTLFEGDPYSLWNIRDLARHAGLAVERSFKFQAGVYPGYKHARTLGIVRKKGGTKNRADTNTVAEDEQSVRKNDNNDQDDKGEQWEESTTAWRGEERPARSYVFIRKDDDLAAKTELGCNEKMCNVGDSSSSDEEEP